MKRAILLLRTKLILLLLLIHCPVLAEEKTGEQFSDLLQIMYRHVKWVEKFGTIRFHVKNEKDNAIGLSSEKLTDFLKLRYKNNFANFPYETIGLLDMISEEQRKKLGSLWCGVWTVGEDYPVAFHLECKLGTYSDDIFKDAVLGVGSKKNVPDTIRKEADRMVSDFAVDFFKYRGEL